MSSAWAFEILYGEAQEIKEESVEGQFKKYSKTCNLVLKAIELIPVLEAVTPAENEGAGEDKETKPRVGVLSYGEIRARLASRCDDPCHIDVVPMLPHAVQSASMDVHLGNWFTAAKRTRLRCVELANTEDERLFELVGRDEFFIAPDKAFLIHPGDLVLGTTLEFVALPNDVMALIEGRSSLGRTGLTVATATQVAPGFHGVIILELANVGTLPLVLKPGIPIAQLVFQHLDRPVPPDRIYRGRYYCQTKP